MSDAPFPPLGPGSTPWQNSATVTGQHNTAKVRPFATARPLAPSHAPTPQAVSQESYGEPIPPRSPGSEYKDNPGYYSPPRWTPMTFTGDPVAPQAAQLPGHGPVQPEPNAQSSESTTLHPNHFKPLLLQNDLEACKQSLGASNSRNISSQSNHASRILHQQNGPSRDNTQQLDAPRPVGRTSSEKLDTQLKDLNRRLTDLHCRMDAINDIQMRNQLETLSSLSKTLMKIHEERLRKQQEKFERLLQETRAELLKDLRPSVPSIIPEVLSRAQVDDGRQATTPIGPLYQPIFSKDKVLSGPLSVNANAAFVPTTNANRAIIPPINPRLPAKRYPVKEGVIHNRQIREYISTPGFDLGLSVPPQPSQGDVLRPPGKIDRTNPESDNGDTVDLGALRRLPQLPQNSPQHSIGVQPNLPVVAAPVSQIITQEPIRRHCLLAEYIPFIRHLKERKCYDFGSYPKHQDLEWPGAQVPLFKLTGRRKGDASYLFVLDMCRLVLPCSRSQLVGIEEGSGESREDRSTVLDTSVVEGYRVVTDDRLDKKHNIAPPGNPTCHYLCLGKVYYQEYDDPSRKTQTRLYLFMDVTHKDKPVVMARNRFNADGSLAVRYQEENPVESLAVRQAQVWTMLSTIQRWPLNEFVNVLSEDQARHAIETQAIWTGENLKFTTPLLATLTARVDEGWGTSSLRKSREKKRKR